MTKGWVIIYITLITTTVLWILSGEFQFRFADTMSTLTSLGQVSGLVGMVLFAFAMILGSRAKFLEKFFESMDLVYRTHHQIGGMSFILLLIHPLFLALSFVPVSLSYAAHFLLPPISNYPVYFGIASMLFMMSFLILTFFVKLPYQFWKFTHKFMGLAFFLGGLHTFFVPSDVSNYLPLKVFMLVIVGISALFYIYRTILGSLLVKKIKYQVSSIKQSGNILEISLKPIGEKLKYEPGQFAFVSFLQKGISKEFHPFSIASSPTDDKVKFLVKSLGDYTKNLKKLTVGTVAKIEGPYGKFSRRKNKNADQVWIAGGIGIAPFLGMARSIDIRADKSSVDLYYCANNENEMTSIQELIEVSETNPGFRMFPFCSDKYGKINIKFIGEMSSELKNREIYLCGPPAMMQSLRQQFRDIGVLNKHIHSEEFQFL